MAISAQRFKFLDEETNVPVKDYTKLNDNFVYNSADSFDNLLKGAVEKVKFTSDLLKFLQSDPGQLTNMLQDPSALARIGQDINTYMNRVLGAGLPSDVKDALSQIESISPGYISSFIMEKIGANGASLCPNSGLFNVNGRPLNLSGAALKSLIDQILSGWLGRLCMPAGSSVAGSIFNSNAGSLTSNTGGLDINSIVNFKTTNLTNTSTQTTTSSSINTTNSNASNGLLVNSRYYYLGDISLFKNLKNNYRYLEDSYRLSRLAINLYSTDLVYYFNLFKNLIENDYEIFDQFLKSRAPLAVRGQDAYEFAKRGDLDTAKALERAEPRRYKNYTSLMVNPTYEERVQSYIESISSPNTQERMNLLKFKQFLVSYEALELNKEENELIEKGSINGLLSLLRYLITTDPEAAFNILLTNNYFKSGEELLALSDIKDKMIAIKNNVKAKNINNYNENNLTAEVLEEIILN